MTRRDIIQRFAAGSVTLLVIPQVLVSCSKDEDDPKPSGNPPGKKTITIDINANPALKNTGGSIITSDILVINLGASYTALSSICTHEGCTVAYNQSVNIIKCPCHFSEYDTTGMVLAGPAPRALKSYTISKEGDILTINL